MNDSRPFPCDCLPLITDSLRPLEWLRGRHVVWQRSRNPAARKCWACKPPPHSNLGQVIAMDSVIIQSLICRMGVKQHFPLTRVSWGLHEINYLKLLTIHNKHLKIKIKSRSLTSWFPSSKIITVVPLPQSKAWIKRPSTLCKPPSSSDSSPSTSQSPFSRSCSSPWSQCH